MVEFGLTLLSVANHEQVRSLTLSRSSHFNHRHTLDIYLFRAATHLCVVVSWLCSTSCSRLCGQQSGDEVSSTSAKSLCDLGRFALLTEFL